jgi:hypothetical protein
MKKRLTTEQFIEKARNVHGDRYDYSKSEYTKSCNKITIICKIHGSFQQNANNHLRGFICNKCADINRIKTNTKKYGFPNPQQNKEVQEKRKKTCLEVYGVESPLGNKEVQEKRKKTCLEVYGKEYPAQTKEVQEKQKQTNIERYNVEYVAQNKDVYDKVKQTNLERYGVEVSSQKHMLKVFNRLIEKEYLENSYKNDKKTMFEIGTELGIAASTVCNYLKKHDIESNYAYSVSSHEKQLQQYLIDNIIEFESSNRTEISPKELDIYIHKYRLAIEINGVYWHSLDINTDVGDNRKRHLAKTVDCLENGIELLQFTDVEWITKQEIVKSMILNKCGLTPNKIFARKCSIIIPTKQEERYFFNANHLQGFSNSSICYGLKYNNEFVSMISFRQPRYTKEFDYEIIRIATKLSTAVVGGISKLFKYFLKNNKNKTVITYADRRYSSGNIYGLLGFEFSHYSNIGYKWIKSGVEYNRVQFQKHKLKNKLEIFDISLSESQNMFLNGYRKLYDCGQLVFMFKPHSSQ